MKKIDFERLLRVTLFVIYSLVLSIIVLLVSNHKVTNDIVEQDEPKDYYLAHNLDGTTDTIHFQQYEFKETGVIDVTFNPEDQFFYITYFDSRCILCNRGPIELRCLTDYVSRLNIQTYDYAFVEGLYSIYVAGEPNMTIFPNGDSKVYYEMIYSF